MSQSTNSKTWNRRPSISYRYIRLTLVKIMLINTLLNQEMFNSLQVQAISSYGDERLKSAKTQIYVKTYSLDYGTQNGT